jgi:HK97 family phage portal protein
MRIGPIEISFAKKKTYRELEAMLYREKGGAAFDPRTNVLTQLAEYKSWTATCVSLIKDRIGQIPYKFYLKDTEEELTSKKHGYKEFSKPFVNPNPLMSFQFVKQFCQIQLDLCGMAAIYKARNQLGQVIELWPVNMNYYMGAYNSEGIPIEMSSEILPNDVFYQFNFNGKQYMFSSQELVLLYYPHPKNPFLSASPIQQQAYAIDIQQYVEIYERDFFANSARIDMVLTTDAPIDENKARELKERWLEKYGFARTGRFNDIAVLDSGLKPVPMKWTNKDFEFMELAQWTKEMIFAAYRVPFAKVGSSGSDNRQNSVYVDINFNTECIKPRLSMWDIELTKEVLSSFDPRIEIRHDNPIPRDRQLEVSEARVYLAGFPSITPNEVRRRIHNLPPVEGGDELYVSTNFIPLSKLEEYIEDQKAKNTVAVDPQDTDEGRHDNDTPHVNPDGSDDRDTSQTPGRVVDFNTIESKIKSFWYKNLLEGNIDTIKQFVSALCESTSIVVLKCFNEEKLIDNSGWLKEYSKKLGEEFQKTIDITKKDYIEQINSNGRIQKLIFNGVRSVINFSKNLILEEYGIEKEWIVDRNICGHGGRLKEFKTMDKFVVGITELKFPLEKFSLDCDCILDFDIDKLQNEKFVKDV